MDRRDRSRDDRDSYGRDYSSGAGYSADDEHYHSARNLTNEFEQHYRSHHPEEERRMRRSREQDYGRYESDRSRRESDYGYRGSRDSRHDDYGSRQQGWGSSGSSSGRSQRNSDFDRDRSYGDQSRYGSQNRYSSGYSDRDSDRNRYSSERSGSSGRYSNIERPGSRESFDRQGSYGDRDRYGSQSRMGENRRREGYGISDYGSMRDSSPRSSRGVPNQGITSSFADDYGTDFDRDRRYGVSSGSFGGYGAHSGDYRRSRDDR